MVKGLATIKGQQFWELVPEMSESLHTRLLDLTSSWCLKTLSSRTGPKAGRVLREGLPEDPPPSPGPVGGPLNTRDQGPKERSTFFSEENV